MKNYNLLSAILIIITMLGLYSCATTLEGTVIDSSTQNGIEGATISITGKSVITNKEGNYYLDDLDEGATTISIEKEGYNSVKDEAIILEKGENFRDFQLVKLNQDITITSPANNELWQKGISNNILWSFTDISGDVKIELLKNGLLLQEIEKSTECDGSYTWIVDNNLVDGNNYKIKITSISNSDVFDESDNFTISSAPLQLAETNEAGNITQSTATLNATVNPKDNDCSVIFEYGPTESYGNEIDAIPNQISGIAALDISANINNLQANSIYHFRVVAISELGIVYGEDVVFQTLNYQAPIVSLTGISDLTENSAVLNGTVNPNGTSTTVVFHYGTTTDYGLTINASQNPIEGSSNIPVSANISGLTTNQSYHYKVIATNDGGTSESDDYEFTPQYFCVDYEQNSYSSIVIGSQIWMTENLRSTKYSDGTNIPLITNTTNWAELGDNNTDVAYCYYDNNSIYSSDYGALYTWSAAMNGENSATANPSNVQGICPDGWHLPSDSEWSELINYLGGEELAGGKMKEIGTEHWASPNEGATNESGFSALPAGFRSSSTGNFGSLHEECYWWTATENNSELAFSRNLQYDSSFANRTMGNKSPGMSVRCVKD